MCFEHAFHHTIQIVDRTVLHQYIYDNIVRQQKVTNYIQGKSENKNCNEK